MKEPKIRFPEFTGEWEEKKLGDIGTFVRGLSYTKTEVTQDKSGTLVIRSNNIIQDGIVDCKNGLQYVTKMPSEEQKLQEGDVVICLANGSSNLVGKSAHFAGDYNGIVTVGAFCGIYRSTMPICKYLVQTSAYKEKIDLIKQGGNGALANLYGRDILDLKFYFPPTIEEQQKIAECLMAIDDQISVQSQKVEALKNQKKGMMQELFPQKGETTPRLRFPRFTEDWEEKKLEDVGTFVRGLSYTKTEVTQDKSGTLVIRSNNIIQDGIVDCKNGLQYVTKMPSEEQKLQEGDVVICLANGSSNLVGKSAHFAGDYNGIVTVGAFCGIYRSTMPICKYLVQTSAYKEKIDLIKQGGNGALANLYGRDILDLKFYFPPTIEEQQKIADCLSELDALIAAETEQLESLKDHKKGLMQQLFPQPAK